jgi:hypothetical protein
MVILGNLMLLFAMFVSANLALASAVWGHAAGWRAGYR